MTRFAYVFPGQGSQSVGMMTEWGEHQAVVSEVYEQASAALGYDLWSLTSQGPAEQLNLTEITQPAMLCAGVASWRIVSDHINRLGVFMQFQRQIDRGFDVQHFCQPGEGVFAG